MEFLSSEAEAVSAALVVHLVEPSFAARIAGVINIRKADAHPVLVAAVVVRHGPHHYQTGLLLFNQPGHRAVCTRFRTAADVTANLLNHGQS